MQFRSQGLSPCTLFQIYKRKEKNILIILSFDMYFKQTSQKNRMNERNVSDKLTSSNRLINRRSCLLLCLPQGWPNSLLQWGHPLAEGTNVRFQRFKQDGWTLCLQHSVFGRFHPSSKQMKQVDKICKKSKTKVKRKQYFCLNLFALFIVQIVLNKKKTRV